MMSNLTFTELTRAAQTVRGLLAKGAGHKYIKRIPVGQTKTGRIKYRYIYKETHTVRGKHLLDEAHLQVGTKLMLETGDGKQVHAHITAVNGDKVTIEYDDGARKGETKTLTKQKLLSEFDEAHGLGQKISGAREKLLADIQAAAEGGISEKQLARLITRLESLGGTMQPRQDHPISEAADEYVSAISNLKDKMQARDNQGVQGALQEVEKRRTELLAEIDKKLTTGRQTPTQQAATLRNLQATVQDILRNPLSTSDVPQQYRKHLSDPARELNRKLTAYEREASDAQTALQAADDDFKKIQAYSTNVDGINPAQLSAELSRVQEMRALTQTVVDRYPLSSANGQLARDASTKLVSIETAIKERIDNMTGNITPERLVKLKQGDAVNYNGKPYRVKSKSTTRGGRRIKAVIEPRDGGKPVTLTATLSGTGELPDSVIVE